MFSYGFLVGCAVVVGCTWSILTGSCVFGFSHRNGSRHSFTISILTRWLHLGHLGPSRSKTVWGQLQWQSWRLSMRFRPSYDAIRGGLQASHMNFLPRTLIVYVGIYVREVSESSSSRLIFWRGWLCFRCAVRTVHVFCLQVFACRNRRFPSVRQGLGLRCQPVRLL